MTSMCDPWVETARLRSHGRIENVPAGKVSAVTDDPGPTKEGETSIRTGSICYLSPRTHRGCFRAPDD
jgi:hypothetical protein